MSINQLNLICSEAPNDLNLTWGIGVKPRDNEFYVVHQDWEARERFTDYLATVIAKLGHEYAANRYPGARDTIYVSLRPRQTVEALAHNIAEHFGLADDKRPFYLNLIGQPSDIPRVVALDAEGLINDAGGEYTFADEYDTCINCGGIIHTGGEHYGDIGRYHLIDGEGYECRACMEKNPTRYAEEYAAQVAKSKVQGFLLDPTADDFIALHGQFENGLHPGMTDNPAKQAAQLIRAIRAKYNEMVAEANAEVDRLENDDSVSYRGAQGARDALDRLENPETSLDVLLMPRFKVAPSQFYTEWTLYVWRPCAEAAQKAVGA